MTGTSGRALLRAGPGSSRHGPRLLAPRRGGVGLVRRRDLVSALVPRRQPCAGGELVRRPTTAFAERARRIGRRCSSIVGPSYDVLALWGELDGWSARSVRADQPLLAMDAPSAVVGRPPGSHRVRRPDRARRTGARLRGDVHRGGRGVPGVRWRVAVRTGRGSPSWSPGGRAFARFDGPEVVFKAELGAVSSRCSQIQGRLGAAGPARHRPRPHPAWPPSSSRPSTSRRSRACTSTSYNDDRPLGVRPGRLRAGRDLRHCAVLNQM